MCLTNYDFRFIFPFRQNNINESVNMKNLGLLMGLGFSSLALADGFQCQTDDGRLNIKAYNHVDAADGTRNAAVMVLSDTNVQAGRKTIAKFQAVETLWNSSATYVGRVDLRFSTQAAGEYVLGTRLGQLKTIVLDVDFNYANPIDNGEPADAKVIGHKRDGSKIEVAATCYRYLKN